MSKSPLLQKNTTVLGKTVNPKSTLGKYANNPWLGPDFSGDKNISGGELVADAAFSLIGGKLAGKALSKIGGGNIKRIGSKVSKFFNSYINPSSGKNIIKETAKMTSKNHPNYFKPNRTFSDLKGDGSLRVDDIKKPKLTIDSALKAPYTFINKGKSNWMLTSMLEKPTKYKYINKGKTNREGYFGMHNKNK